MKKVIISVDNESHKLVEDEQDKYDCAECSLYQVCKKSDSDAICCFFSDKLSHFEKVEGDE